MNGERNARLLGGAFHSNMACGVSKPHGLALKSRSGRSDFSVLCS